MMMLELDGINSFGTSGSGNQKKFWVNGILVKLDSKNRESKKERDASIIARSFGLDAVIYDVGKYEYNGSQRNGCYCKSYLRSNEKTVALIDILNFYNVVINSNMSSSDFFRITCECIFSYTGLDARLYLMNMLVFDFLIANRDRHLSNIEFISGVGYFRFVPIFDNGQSFFGTDAMLTSSQLEQSYRKYKSMPFSRNPRSNLIDINMAKSIAERFKMSCSGFNSIQVDVSRLKVVNFMYNKLMSM